MSAKWERNPCQNLKPCCTKMLFQPLFRKSKTKFKKPKCSPAHELSIGINRFFYTSRKNFLERKRKLLLGYPSYLLITLHKNTIIQWIPHKVRIGPNLQKTFGHNYNLLKTYFQPDFVIENPGAKNTTVERKIQTHL